MSHTDRRVPDILSDGYSHIGQLGLFESGLHLATLSLDKT